jgi:hypothetical protein
MLLTTWQSFRSGDVGSLPPIRSALPNVLVPQHPHSHLPAAQMLPQHPAVVGGVGWLPQQQQHQQHQQHQQQLAHIQPSLNLAIQQLHEASQTKTIYQVRSNVLFQISMRASASTLSCRSLPARRHPPVVLPRMIAVPEERRKKRIFFLLV